MLGMAVAYELVGGEAVGSVGSCALCRFGSG